MSVYNIDGDALENGVFDVTGEQLLQAYDIEGTPLISDYVQILPNQASGDSSGYSFSLPSTSYSYPLYNVVDFSPDSYAYQSFGYDPTNNVFYKFDASTTVAVYNASFQKTGTITLPQSAGHTGDTCYYNGKMYFPGDVESSGIYVWDISNNTISELTVSGVESPTSPVERIMGGVCNVPNESGFLYLMYADRQSNPTTHNNDKLQVYKYNISTHAAVLMAEYTWDCVYLQGAEISDGILYATCNSPTTGSVHNYTGITLKAFRTDTWEELRSLAITGSFEPEGMCMYPYSQNHEIMMGIAKYNTFAKATRFSVPYKLIVME